MTFDDILDHAIEMLQRRKRVSYRALKRQFDLDEDYLEDLKLEIIEIQQVAVDQDGSMLVWTGETGTASQPTAPSTQIEQQSVSQESQPTLVEPPSTEPRAPEAERRQLTILFTDLVESTKLSGQLDAEEYREIVRAYQVACAEVIERFDCHLAQTLGDGLLVYSGYPVAHENDAERAVHVGLGILDAMQALNERLDKDKGIQLGVRVGIHTGAVVIGDVGVGSKQEQLALGEAPNVAARIQGLAEPNTVVISEVTHRLVQGYFDCESMEEHALRGVAEPIVVYQVLSESGAQSRLDIASARGLTPLVGREQEVGLLLDRWGQAKDGNGQVILLSGEAGIGKSRAVQVLKDHVTNEPHTRWECRSSPYYQNTALYPIIDLIQRTLPFQPDDTAEQKLEKLEQALGQYRLPVEEAVPLFVPLLSLAIPEDRYPPLRLSSQRQRQKTLESIIAIILEQAEQQPVLFILEDLHWLDPTSLELLDLLIAQTPTASLGVLLTCRPTFQPLWSSRSYLTHMTLNRLSQLQITRIAEHIAGGKRLPAAVLEHIVEKTDGVPLYVEEMTKSVLESGMLKEMDGHYALIGSTASLSIPSTLQDSLMSRLDRLVTAKAVAQYASVIGRQFSYELLQAVSQLDEAMLQHELNRLVEAELVYQRGVIPQATYLFKHALIQDIAYASLLRRTRQGYHRCIAEVLEERFPKTAANQPELLAHHCTEGGLNGQAVAYWHQAGRRAVERSANIEAITHLTRGLQILERLPETAARDQDELSLLITLGPAYIATKGYTASEVEDVYTRAYELCRQVGEATQRAAILSGLRRFYLVRGDLKRARETGEQLLTLAQSQPDSILLLDAYWSLSGLLFHLGELTLVQHYLDEAIALFVSHKEHSQIIRHGTIPGVHCLCWLSLTLWMRGYPDQALQRGREALAIARQHTSAFALQFALVHTAILHTYRRDASRIQEYLEERQALLSGQGDSWSISFLQGCVFLAQGKGAQGIPPIRRWLDESANLGYSPYAVALLAECYLQTRQAASGLNTITEGLALIAKMGSHNYEAELYRLKGHLLLQQSSDNATEAASCFHQAISIAQSQSTKSLELRASTSLARLWLSQNRRQDACDLLAPVYNWFTEGHDTADLIDAKALLDELSEGAS